MRKVTQTLWGLDLMIHMLNGKPYVPRANTTLNEKFTISVPTPAPGLVPKLKFLCLGKGGHAAVTGSDGFPLTHIHQHEPDDAAAYYPMPFVLRLQTNDIPPERRLKYALRRAETHGGLNYFAYYAMRIDLAAADIDINRLTTIGGVEQSVPYVPSTGNLNPTPPAIPADSSIPALPNGDAVEVNSVTTIRLTSVDILELVEVARILHNDERYAVISEVLLCSGIDVETTVPSGGGAPMSFTEAAYVQVTQFINMHKPLEDSDDFMDLNVDVGASEALSTSI